MHFTLSIFFHLSDLYIFGLGLVIMIICTRYLGKGLGVPGNRKHPWEWPCIHTHIHTNTHTQYIYTHTTQHYFLFSPAVHPRNNTKSPNICKKNTALTLNVRRSIWKSVSTFFIRSVHFLESTVTPGTRNGLLISLPRKSLRSLMSLYLLLFPIHTYKQQQFSITV